MTMYFVRQWVWSIPDIEEVEVDRETDSSVWVKGKRNAKILSYQAYFHSRDEAAQWILANATKAVGSAVDDVVQANIHLKDMQQNLDAIKKKFEV